MPQHFTDGFKRDTMRKRDLGGVGMASAVKDEFPFNSANGGNTFQCPVGSLLLYIGSSFPSGAISRYLSRMSNGMSSNGTS